MHTPSRLPATAIWRTDPALSGQFHPEFPDHLQVIVHDGEPRRTRHTPELCWVEVIAAEQPIARSVIHVPEATQLSQQEFGARYGGQGPVYVGILLNAPHALTSVRQGDRLRFLAVPGSPHPLHVTSDYLRERPRWGVVPCHKCGASECFDPPTVMARTRFPAMPPEEVLAQFTAFCALCGGIQMLAHIARQGDGPPAPPAPKPWWRFW